MGSIWSNLRSRTESEKRFSLDDYANMMNFGGHTYPLMGLGPAPGTKSESIDNNFAGYVNGMYKQSGAVFAVCMARMLIFTEMRFQFQRMSGGRPGDLFGNQELTKLENPWPRGTTGEMNARALQDTDFAGNFYVLDAGDRLRRMRPDWVDIMLSGDPTEDENVEVIGHIYKPGGNKNPDRWKVYPIDGSMGHVAHWSPIPDPEAGFRGMSWLTPLIREVRADKSAMDHKQKFFDNGASPQIAVAFKETVTEKQFETLVKNLDRGHSGVDNAYKTMYLGGGADVTVVGKDLQQLDFKKTQGANETRIAAAGRVPAAIVGFSEGLEGSAFRNSGEFDAAREMFGSGCLRPLWRSYASAMAILVKEPGGSRLWYDDRDIAFLRRDQKEQSDMRAQDGHTINQYIMAGFEPDTAVQAVLHNDISLLVHSGLVSVQMQELAPPDPNAADPQAADNGKSDSAQPTNGNGKAPTPNSKGGQAK